MYLFILLFIALFVCLVMQQWAIGIHSPAGAEHLLASSPERPDWLCGKYRLVCSGYRKPFPLLKSRRSVKLSTQLHLMSTLRMNGAVCTLPHTPSWHFLHWSRRQFQVSVFINLKRSEVLKKKTITIRSSHHSEHDITVSHHSEHDITVSHHSEHDITVSQSFWTRYHSQSSFWTRYHSQSSFWTRYHSQ